MIRVALKGIATRRLRVVLTALSIVLGVAMVSGAYTLTDTMRNAAHSLSSSAYNGTDAVVVAHQEFKTSQDDNVQAPTIPAATLDRVRSAPGVQTALGSITDQAKIVGKNGKTTGGGPYFGAGVDGRRPAEAARLTPFRIETGRYATGPGEVVIDAGTASKEKYGIGKEIRIATRGPVRTFRVVGIATFGSVKSIGTATFAIFDLRTAQSLYAKQGRYDEVLVHAAPGTGAAALRTGLERRLGTAVDVQSAKAQDRFTLDGLNHFIGIIQKILIGFGLVSVFVGAFIIFNTLSITVAQRTRELGLLRSLGASRRQVLRSVVAEALAIGSVASALGLFAGLFLAKGLQSVFASSGIDLPQTGTVFATRTIVVALMLGLVVTLVASLSPALRATRVPPVAVLQEGAVAPQSAVARQAPKIALVTTASGLAMLIAGSFAHGIPAGGRFALMVPGVLVLFTGIALLAPRLVRPLASVLGAPAARLAGVAGRLARSNTMRNPRRTAVTASALMIGIALVAFVAVVGNGLKDSASGSIERATRADYVIGSQDAFSPVDPDVLKAAGSVPGVKVATGVKRDIGRSFGDKVSVGGADPARLAQVYRFSWKQGSDRTLATLPADGAVVSKSYASDHHLTVGKRFSVLSSSGTKLSLRVAAIQSPPKLNPLDLGQVLVGDATYSRAFATQRVTWAFVDTNGASASQKAALEKALAGFPDAKVFTRSGFAHDQVKWIDQVAGIFYAMLALSVLISLFGIVNTLVLSVFERTRELGMLRAVGMSRRQVRRMIRHESVVTALIGAVLGTAVGLLLAGLVTAALSDEGLSFAVPVGSLVAFAAVAGIAGVVAAVFPARRAARLDVLQALQYE
ncbi:MAG: putative transport system permease protein [Thermoleophilaceae bacterium]|nr:putative transport system permease protein [Thermoleophilaceae bacterium]